MKARVLTVIVIVAGAVAGVSSTANVPAPVAICVVNDAMRERARSIMLDGLAQGLKNQTVKVFEIWLTDPSDQPRRAIVGLHNAVSAFVRSTNNLQHWNPPLCPEGRTTP